MPESAQCPYDRGSGKTPVTLARTLSGDHVALESAVIDAFASRLAGRVLVESAAEYEQARRVWNGLIDKRPAVIVQCSGSADVLDSLMSVMANVASGSCMPFARSLSHCWR
jgi:hypothetical protein